MVSANTMQYLNQLGGLLTFVDIEDGGVAKAYKLVPVTHWHNGNKFPHNVEKDLRSQAFKRTVVEGLEYYLIPESTTNSVGQVAHYAVASHEPAEQPRTTAPKAVSKYLKRETAKPKKVVDSSS